MVVKGSGVGVYVEGRQRRGGVDGGPASADVGDEAAGRVWDAGRRRRDTTGFFGQSNNTRMMSRTYHGQYWHERGLT